MAESSLTDFVNFLTQYVTDTPSKELSYVNGKLSVKPDKYQHCNPTSTSADRYVVMRLVSSKVKSNFNALLKAAAFNSRRCCDFVKNDIESISQDFMYFANWANKIDSTDNGSSPASVTFVILGDCSILSTLSRFTACFFAAGYRLRIYVDEKYLVPALSFVFFLHQSGVAADAVDVFPSTHETFPKNKILHAGLIGIIPMNSSYYIGKPRHTAINKFHLKKHSARPLLVLKSADIDSAVACLMQSTQDLETLWVPNVVYVEEPVYKRFLDTLKCVVDIRNKNLGDSCLDAAGQECVRAFVNAKNKEGYQVITLHHRFHASIFVVNYDFSLLSESKRCCNMISIVPVRHAQEAVSEINKNKSLCASVWTNDIVQATSLPLVLEYGTIWLNCASCYDVSVPLSMWNSHGVGSLSGKRMFFEVVQYPSCLQNENNDQLYARERNFMLPKRTLTEILKQSTVAQISWSKTKLEDRLNSLTSTAAAMQQNWDNHFKIIMNQTSEYTWKSSIKNLNFWSTFVTESMYEQVFYVNNYLVTCKSEPVGIIAILAGTIALDTLCFYVAAALAYGNSVIIGLCTNEPSSIIANEFERLFKKDLVNVYIDESEQLWRRFTENKNIASFWLYGDKTLTPVTVANYKSVFILYDDVNRKDVTECMETYVTRSKCVWLPHL